METISKPRGRLLKFASENWRWRLLPLLFLLCGVLVFKYWVSRPRFQSRPLPVKKAEDSTIYQISSNRMVVIDRNAYGGDSVGDIPATATEFDLDANVATPIPEFEQILNGDELVQASATGGDFYWLSFAFGPNGDSLICWRQSMGNEKGVRVAVAKRGAAEPLELHFIDSQSSKFNEEYGILQDGEHWARVRSNRTSEKNVICEVRDFEGGLVSEFKLSFGQFDGKYKNSTVVGICHDKVILYIWTGSTSTVVFQDLRDPNKKTERKYVDVQSVFGAVGAHGMFTVVAREKRRLERTDAFPFFRMVTSIPKDKLLFFSNDGRAVEINNLESKFNDVAEDQYISWQSIKLLEDGETFAVPANDKIYFIPKD